MENVKEITVVGFGGQDETHVVIEHADGSFTSMLKSTYDAQIAASDTLPSNSSDFSQPIGGNE
jgi:hypothetical protein